MREDDEFAVDHAAGARHIGRGVLERDVETLIPDKDAPIVLYCGGGFRSALAADNLQKMGYTNVVSMDGGIRAWREAGYPVDKGDRSQRRRERSRAVRAAIIACDDCPRLRRYCARIAREKKAAHRDDTYWGRPVPGFGDPAARLLLVGLAPAAHGANRTGRVFTGDGSGDFLDARAARHRLRQHPDLAQRRRRAGAARRVHPGGRALRAARQQADARGDRALPAATWPPRSRRCRACAWSWRWARSATTRTWPIWPRRTACARAPRRRSATAARRASAPGCPMLLGCYHPSRQNTNTGKLTPPMMRSVFRARARHHRRREIAT